MNIVSYDDQPKTEAKTKRRAKSRLHKESFRGKIFDVFNIFSILMLCCVTLYPFWYVLVMSFNDGQDAALGPIWFWPREFTLNNYIYALANPYIKLAFLITLARALTAPIISVSVMLLAAFSLSKRHLPGRKAILYYLMVPMFFGGSIVSNYVVMAKLGLLNNFLVYIIPGAFNFFLMIIIRTFIEQLPEGLEESAMMDGAGYFQILYKVIVPLSSPIIAAMMFFGVVGAWLDLSANLLYVTKEKLFVLQYVLYTVVLSTQSDNIFAFMKASGTVPQNITTNLPTPQVLKMSTLMLVTMPLVFVYPFFQRYFVTGLLVGAIKA